MQKQRGRSWGKCYEGGNGGYTSITTALSRSSQSKQMVNGRLDVFKFNSRLEKKLPLKMTIFHNNTIQNTDFWILFDYFLIII